MLWQRSGRAVVQQSLPILGKLQQSAIELLWLGILPRRRKGWIAVAIHNLGDLTVLDTRRTMPRVDDVFVLIRPHIAEEDDLPIAFARSCDDFAHGRHPAAHEPLVDMSLLGRLAQSRKVLARVISAGTSTSVDRSDVVGFLCSHKRRPHPRILLRRRHWRSGSSHCFRIRIAML